MLAKVDGLFREIEKGQVFLSTVSTLFVTFMIVSDVLLRFFLNKPLPASWEISEVMMPYIVMFGFAYTLTKNVHVRVSILTDRLPEEAQRATEMFGNVICFLMCMLLTYWSWLRFWESFLIREEILAPIKIPWWIGKLAMPVAFGMFAIRYLARIILKSRK